MNERLDVTEPDSTHLKWLLSVLWEHQGRKATVNQTFPRLAMTSLNGIWPAECLGSVRGWCQIKCKQVRESAVFMTSCNSNSPSRHHPPFPGGICWSDSLGNSVEGGVCVLSYVLLYVDGWVGGDGRGVGEGDEKQRWKKQPPLPPKYSAQGWGSTPYSCSHCSAYSAYLHIPSISKQPCVCFKIPHEDVW